MVDVLVIISTFDDILPIHILSRESYTTRALDKIELVVEDKVFTAYIIILQYSCFLKEQIRKSNK
ncbi:hypothetical protein [Flexithrix dorotheae]|uniref:hypothetical protein n=1 Tax=Flexithrix dorotheae TaxID=70993 RepID=UPI000375FB25|nr:hypothetical protein [Flexithrix dorotheae]